jgi:L-fucose mutarotase
MGHGDEVALADAHFPAAATARRAVRLDGVDIVRVLEAVLSVLPVDHFEPDPLVAMRPAAEGDPRPAAIAEMQRVVYRHTGGRVSIALLDRFAFYERARAAFGVIATGERRFYGNVIVRKGQAERAGGDEGRPGRRHLLQAGGQVRRLPDRRVVHPEIAAHRADDDLSRVQADANVGAHGLGPPERLRVAGHGLMHLECRVAGAHGVILVRERRPEQGHDPVAHHLVDRALVAVDRLHHPLEHRIEEFSRLLRIPVGQELHRALQVREEHRDVLPLTLHGAAGAEDLLDEVLRRVRLRRGDGCLLREERGPAGAAELLARSDWLATGGAGEFEARATVLAEPGAVGTRSMAPGTLHARDPFQVRPA